MAQDGRNSKTKMKILLRYLALISGYFLQFLVLYNLLTQETRGNIHTIKGMRVS